MASGSNLIPGESTINFDKISKERIFKSIDTANLSLKKDLIKDYELLKYKLGKIPTMLDFIEHGSRDPELFVEYSRSYYNFVEANDSAYKVRLPNDEKKLLELFSNEINNGIRIEESFILKHLTLYDSIDIEELKSLIQNRYGIQLNDETINSAILNLNFEFVTENKEGKLLTLSEIYHLNTCYIENNSIKNNNKFKSQLLNEDFRKLLLDDTVYSIRKWESSFDIKKYIRGFILYNKYSRKDVFRILNWQKNPMAQNVGGYIISKDKSQCPIFVNYHKSDDISSTTKYEDRFISNSEFEWMSKSKRTLNSPDVQVIRQFKSGLHLPLFVKKNNDEGAAFYYLGDVKPKEDSFIETSIKDDKGNNVSLVKITFELNHQVEDSLYSYITNS